MDLKNVFQWVDKVSKSLPSAWTQSFGKGRRIKDSSWNLLPENAEYNFKYTFLIWNVIDAHFWKNAREGKIKENKTHFAITHLDATLLHGSS